MKDFKATDKPSKGKSRNSKVQRKKNGGKKNVYSNKHVRQQLLKTENSKNKNIGNKNKK